VAPRYLRDMGSTLYIAFGPTQEIDGLIYVHDTKAPNTEEINWVCKPSSATSGFRMHVFLRAVMTLRLQENPALQQFRLDAVGSERARPLYERVGFVPMPGGDEDEMLLRRQTLLKDEGGPRD